MRDRPLATPAYQFTIPSLIDGLLLDCRIYHPRVLDGDGNENDDDNNNNNNNTRAAGPSPAWSRKGAVVAHPYAPLGGSMDDPVVMTVAEQLLDMDVVVGTFNFRGAPGSRGSTTWTGKAEREDYISFAACLVHYLHSLNIQGTNRAPSAVEKNLVDQGKQAAPTGSQPAPPNDDDDSITIIFGGYSYGSLIVSQLPETSQLLQHFKDPAAHNNTSATEIVLRAQQLATRTNDDHDQRVLARRGRQERQASHSYGHRKSTSHHSVIYGGEEMSLPTTAAAAASGGETNRETGARHRNSHDIPHRIKNHLIHRRHSSSSKSQTSVRRSGSHPTQTDAATIALPDIKALYLLVSPLLPPLSSFLSSSSSLSSLLLLKTPDPPPLLVHNPTLVVYGSTDGFTSARRMRAWCEKMMQSSRGPSERVLFAAHEQEGAGHFWRERGALGGLVGAVEGWVGDQLCPSSLTSR